MQEAEEKAREEEEEKNRLQRLELHELHRLREQQQAAACAKGCVGFTPKVHPLSLTWSPLVLFCRLYLTATTWCVEDVCLFGRQ